MGKKIGWPGEPAVFCQWTTYLYKYRNVVRVERLEKEKQKKVREVRVIEVHRCVRDQGWLVFFHFFFALNNRNGSLGNVWLKVSVRLSPSPVLSVENWPGGVRSQPASKDEKWTHVNDQSQVSFFNFFIDLVSHCDNWLQIKWRPKWICLGQNFNQ